MARKLPLALAALLFAGLALHAYNQDQRITRLRADLEALRAATGAPDPRGAGQPSAEPPPAAQPAAEAARGAPPAISPRPPAPAAEGSAAPARGAVTQAEIARVESAVLTLLESDRPELRTKLRQVVEEQRDAEDAAQQERNRERYIAATEARLAELSGPAALTPAQRQAVLDILLANRDQIIDVMRSADSAESFAAARGKVQHLRDESDARVKELLNEAQYKAYKETASDRDFGRGMGVGVGSGRRGP